MPEVRERVKVNESERSQATNQGLKNVCSEKGCRTKGKRLMRGFIRDDRDACMRAFKHRANK